MSETKQPIWEFVANLGDVNVAQHGGFLVYRDTTGVYPPEVELYEADDDETGGTRGKTYSFGRVNRCPNCGWKRPMDVTVWECIEPLPEGTERPEDWKVVKLGDILTTEGKTE